MRRYGQIRHLLRRVVKARTAYRSPEARRRHETVVSHKDLAATISGMDSPGRLGVQDSDQAQAAVRYNRDQAAEKSFYAPKTPNMPKKNVSA